MELFTTFWIFSSLGLRVFTNSARFAPFRRMVPSAPMEVVMKSASSASSTLYFALAGRC